MLPDLAVDGVDLDGEIFLAVADAAVEALAAGEAFDVDFVGCDFAEDGGGDGGTGDDGWSDLDAGIAGDEEDLVEGDGGLTVGEIAEVDFKAIARLDFESECRCLR